MARQVPATAGRRSSLMPKTILTAALAALIAAMRGRGHQGI